MDWFGLVFLSVLLIMPLCLVAGGVFLIRRSRRHGQWHVLTRPLSDAASRVLSGQPVLALDRRLTWIAGLVMIAAGVAGIALVLAFGLLPLLS